VGERVSIINCGTVARWLCKIMCHLSSSSKVLAKADGSLAPKQVILSPSFSPSLSPAQCYKFFKLVVSI
jgi:hypothetical protein